MDRRETKIQASGICNRLFNFLIESLLFRGLKRVTLGRPRESCSFGGSNPATEESNMHNLAYGMPRKAESLVERANKLNNSFPITSIGSSVLVQKKGDKEPSEEFLELQSPPLRAITVTNSIIREQDETWAKARREEEAVISSAATVSQGRNPIKDGAEERDVEKKKGKKVLTEAFEPERDVKVRPATPIIPVISSAFNIDERSEALIRRTREALRNNL